MTSQEARIRELESQLAQRDEMIGTLQNSIDELNHLVTNLTEIIQQMRKDKYGPSSEKTVVTDGSCEQLSLFNEVELEADGVIDEPVEKISKGKVTPKSKRVRKVQIIKDLPVTEVLCEAPDEALTCPKCHTDLKVLGKEVVREELEYIPAQLRIVKYVRFSYECPKCKHTDRPYIIKAGVPTSLMNHSLASPSSVANVIYQKYVNGIPLYRQEKDWERMGIVLSRATMANWTIKCADDYITPVVDRMKELLLKRDILHADETPVQVLREPGKKPQTKSYMWLYRTGNDGDVPIILYDYRPSRSGDNAEEYIKGFNGYLHTDGYSGYNKLTGVTRCGCWAHLRRKFDEALPIGKASEATGSYAQQGIAWCNKLFSIEKDLADMSPEDRYNKRLELEKPVLEAFWAWLDSFVPLRGSKLAKAVTYARNQKPYLENYLKDGRCAISNNIAENAIRPFVTGRKNWLFADTPKGATSSAAIYSIVETAKANGLDVFAYLEQLLMHMPDWDHTSEFLDELMPWSEFMQETCGK
jgi:transposase